MSKPTDLAIAALKRFGRYLRSRPRLVFRMPFQAATTWDVYTDTDWAGCARTRKSTSGGCLMLGCHVIKFWSATQASLALSSGEAEFYGVVRGAGMGLGQQALGRDAGFELPIRVWTDSSAAMGTAARQGLGKLRHLECHSLWVQQRLRRREFELRKVLGTENPADLFTKHMDAAAKLDGLVQRFGCDFREGRPEAAPQLKRVHLVACEGTRSRRASGSTARGCCGPALSVQKALPHLLPLAEMDELHPRAEPEQAALGEPDQTPMEDLADPVPRLRAAAVGERSTSTSSSSTARADGRPRPAAARAVGECLSIMSSSSRNPRYTSSRLTCGCQAICECQTETASRPKRRPRHKTSCTPSPLGCGACKAWQGTCHAAQPTGALQGLPVRSGQWGRAFAEERRYSLGRHGGFAQCVCVAILVQTERTP